METNNNELLEKNGSEHYESSPISSTGSSYYNNNVENGSKKNFKALITMLVVIVVLFFACVLAMLTIKSDEEKFFDLLVNKQVALDLAKEMNNDMQNSEQLNTSFEIDVADIVKTFGADLGTDLKVGLNFESVVKNENLNGLIEIELNDKLLGFVEYAKTGDIYGVKMDETTDKFIAIENKDLQSMLEKFEVTEVEKIPNKILTKDDFESVMKMTESDYKRISKKYSNIILKNMKDTVSVEDDVKVKIADKEITTKKYTLELTEEDVYNVEIGLLKELKDDKKNVELVRNDIIAVFKLMEDNGYPVKEIYGVGSEEFPTIDEIMEELEKIYEDEKNRNVENLNGENEPLKISVYEHEGKTVITEIAVGDSKIKFESFIDEEIYMACVFEENEEVAIFGIEGKRVDNRLEAEIFIEVEEIKLKLCNIKYEYIDKSEKEFVELSNETALILNNATKEEFNKFGEELAEGLKEFAEEKTKELENVLPLDELMNLTTNITPDYSYDDYYDYNYDFDYDDYDLEVEEKTDVLVKAKDLYSKIEIGESRESVIQKLGEPDKKDEYIFETLEWEYDDITIFSVTLDEGKVMEKRIEAFSSKYSGVYLGKELKATLEDLNKEISKIKEGMTLEEVKAVLGDAMFESKRDDYGDITYTWYDKQEQNVGISFEDGKVWYIGIVW